MLNSLQSFFWPTLIAWLAYTQGHLQLGLGFFALWCAIGLVRAKRHLRAFNTWLSRDLNRPLPQLPGLWEEMVGRLYRKSKLQNRQQHSLTQALITFRSAAQAMPDGVITLDERDCIQWINGAAEAQFGLVAGRDVQQPLFNFVRHPEVVHALREQHWGKPVQVRNHRGQILAVQFVTFGAGQKLLLARDITQLEKLETMRRDFVANVSHELKTPLTVLAGFLETMQDYPDLPAEQQTYYIKLMYEQAMRMQNLVEDLLALSALEAGGQANDEAPIAMQALMQRLTQDGTNLSAGKHSIKLIACAEVNLLGHEAEVVSALANFVSNAVRYTPEQGEIRLSWAIRGDGCGVFSVQDTGIGIQAQHIPRLTERFYRVDRARSRDTGGTGLGLAIVKHVLTRHQAQLEIESEYGKGSQFSAVFPANRILPTPSQSTH